MPSGGKLQRLAPVATDAANIPITEDPASTVKCRQGIRYMPRKAPSPTGRGFYIERKWIVKEDLKFETSGSPQT